jgi:RNA polymerase sigma-70 factor (family 1)
MQHDPFSTDASTGNLTRIAAGDESAFREVYLHFFKRLYQFAHAFVKSREPAEELVEDVFVRLWQQRATVTGIQNLRVYLYIAIKNSALNYLAQKARQSITEPFDHIHIGYEGAASSPEQLLITAEIHQKIQLAVEALPPRCKMIFKLVREDGLKYKEIAGILNISVNTIDAQMAIAIKRITSAIGGDFDFPIKKAARQIISNQ